MRTITEVEALGEKTYNILKSQPIGSARVLSRAGVYGNHHDSNVDPLHEAKG